MCRSPVTLFIARTGRSSGIAGRPSQNNAPPLRDPHPGALRLRFLEVAGRNKSGIRLNLLVAYCGTVPRRHSLHQAGAPARLMKVTIAGGCRINTRYGVQRLSYHLFGMKGEPGARRSTMDCKGREYSLAELVADPLIGLLMKSDGVDRRCGELLFDQVGRARDPQAPSRRETY